MHEAKGMKGSTLNSVLVARALHDEAMRLVDSDDRHLSSAGMILLQDALEIILLAMLIERDVDEQKALESKTFDELIGEVKKAHIPVPKSGTLKALNKQRVITKHYGQLAEPVTVRNYAEAATVAIEAMVEAVTGRKYRDIFLVDLLENGESRDFLVEASNLLDQKKYLDALIAVRKAIFVEIEIEYSVHEWREGYPTGNLAFLMMGRSVKAPYWTRDAKWISENVKTPFDYIQIDYDRLRLDAMEWGVGSADLRNLMRLTPEVFRERKDGGWCVQHRLEFEPNEANAANAAYCLDRAISVLWRKQRHITAQRWPKRQEEPDAPTFYVGAAVYAKASKDSDVVHYISEEFDYRFESLVSGFDPAETYYKISGYVPVDPLGEGWFSGFLLKQDAVAGWTSSDCA